MSFWHNKLEINFLRVKSLYELSQMYFNEIYKNILVFCFTWWPSELWDHCSSTMDEVKISLLKEVF